MLARSLAQFALFVSLFAALSSTAPAASMIPASVASRHGLTRGWYAQVGTLRGTGPIIHVHHDGDLLLVQTEQSILTALDAETGRMLWSTEVGKRGHACTEPAVNSKYAAVINGSVLFVLDRHTGRLLWQRALFGSPGAGPALTETHAFTPMVGGLIEAYNLEKGAVQHPWNYKSTGRILVPPRVTHDNVIWTTEKGHLYVANPAAEGVKYRLETRDSIHAQPAFWTPHIFAASTDGYVYAVNEATGKMEWKFPLGDAIYEPPVAIDGKLYVVCSLGGMFCLDTAEARRLWYAPKIAQFMAVSKSRVYACDQVGRMVVLDAGTGTQLSSMPLDDIAIKVINRDSDRVYLATAEGVVQCLREIGLKKPLIHEPPHLVKPAPPSTPKGGKKAKAAAEASEEPSAEQPAMEEAPDENVPAENVPDENAPAEEEAMPEQPAADKSADPFG